MYKRVIIWLGFLYLGVEFIVAEIKGRVDRFEGFKVYVDALFLAIVRQYGAAIEHQSVVWHSGI